jgi:hypothetical protein
MSESESQKRKWSELTPRSQADREVAEAFEDAVIRAKDDELWPEAMLLATKNEFIDLLKNKDLITDALEKQVLDCQSSEELFKLSESMNLALESNISSTAVLHYLWELWCNKIKNEKGEIGNMREYLTENHPSL